MREAKVAVMRENANPLFWGGSVMVGESRRCTKQWCLSLKLERRFYGNGKATWEIKRRNDFGETLSKLVSSFNK
jgi:hypothetical protein